MPTSSTGDSESAEARTSSIDGSTPAARVNAANVFTSRPHQRPARRAPAAESSTGRDEQRGIRRGEPRRRQHRRHQVGLGGRRRVEVDAQPVALADEVGRRARSR